MKSSLPSRDGPPKATTPSLGVVAFGGPAGSTARISPALALSWPKIEPVLAKFAQYCQPRKNVPFERYRFNRQQEPGETYDQYRTELRKLAEGCEFQTISPDEILRDRLVFGIQDNKVRDRRLRESSLTLLKTDEICHAAESMLAQMKVVGDNSGATVSAVRAEQDHLHNPIDQTKKTLDAKPVRECWNCGRKHEYRTRESCPVYGKVCNKCQNPTILQQNVVVARPSAP